MFTAPLTATFDADNRQISKGDPTDPFVAEVWRYDNAGRLTSHDRAAMSGTFPDQTVLQYDPSGRVVRQTLQTQSSMGAPLIRSDNQFLYNAAGELIAQTDGRGYTSVTTYNSRGLVASETAPDPDGACSQFGLIVSHAYDNMGRKTSVDRGFGRVTTQEYNNRSWITKITKPDPDGAGALTAPVILMGYNLRGDQTTLTDPLGNVTTTAYDNQQRATRTTYPDPDGGGALAAPVTRKTYNALGWVTSTTDARGGVTDFTFDAVGRVLTQTQPDPDGAGPLARPVTTNEYDAVGLSKVTDPLGNATTFVRDGNGRATSTTDAQGGVTSLVFDTYGNVLSQTDPDPDGAGPLARPVTLYTYDSLNRVTNKIDALNKYTYYTYDVAGNLISLKDPNNNTTNFAYDGWNRQVLDTNALSKSQSRTFDVAGNLSRAVDRNGRVTQFDYDALDRQTTEKWQSSTTVPTLSISTTQEGGTLGEQQSIGWSLSGMGMSGTFTLTQNGQTTAAIAWNASEATILAALESLSSIGAGNVVVDAPVPSGSTYSRTIGLTFRNAKYGIDLPQTTINTTGLVPGYGSITPFGTTTANGGIYSETQTIALANATGGTWRLAYNGEITGALSPSITDAQVKTALDSFASISSVTVTGSSGSFSVTFGGAQANTNMNAMFGDAANATNGSMLRTITTVYDANNRVTSISDSSATIASTFDNLGRATSIVNTIAGLTPTVTLGQSFDATSNRTQLTAKIGTTNDFKNTYQYDALHRLTDVVQQSQSGGNAVTSKHIAQVFNAGSQRTTISRYQSTGTSNAVASSTFTFDTVNRLTGIAHKQGATNLNSYTYTYDGLSRPTSVVSTAEGTSSYSYDTISQVTGATHTGQSNETYGFDANGNRNTTGYTVGTNNQTTAGLGFTFTYDFQGNRQTRTETSTGKVQSYEWDYRNRLTAVVDRNTSGGAIVKRVDYEYDAYNRLVKRSLDADGAGPNPATTQYWAYDEGINAVLQFDGSASTNLSHRYLWSDRVDELFADEQITSPSVAGNTLWGLADNLGTLRDIADFNESTGVTTVTNHRTFNANGKLVAETNAAVDLLFAFTGKQLDDATSLQHNLNRWYDANLGQWLSEDPIGFAAGDANLRRYVGNGALNRTDPSGLWWWDDDWLELGVGGLLGLQGQEVQSAAGASIIANPLRGGLDALSVVDPTPLSGGVSRILDGAINGDAVSAVFIDIALEALPGPSPKKGSRVAGVISRKNPTVGISRLPDNAHVVRGGTNTPELLASGIGDHPSGVRGVSVQSAAGKSIEDLPEGLRYGKIGSTTVGEVRKIGGDVIPTSGTNPDHATLTGLSPEVMSGVLQPLRPNPAKGK